MLVSLYREIIKLYNKCYHSKSDFDRKAFKKAQMEYKKELELAGSHANRITVCTPSNMARFCRVLRSSAFRQEGHVKTH